jgi:acyl-CoA thioesterase I
MAAADGSHRRLRICAVGDELVAGVGDGRALGWVGRVAARTPRAEASVTVFPLGVPGESTGGLVARWQDETARRFGPPPVENRLVIGLGHGDLYRDLTLARSRLNLADVLDAAHANGIPTFVVGPPPGGGDSWNERVAYLAEAFADVCGRRGVPFVDTFAPLISHEAWLTDLAAGDGASPGQAGYGLIAWLILHGGWTEWLGLA